MFRRVASGRTDKKYFMRTASHGATTNLMKKIFRGGIRF